LFLINRNKDTCLRSLSKLISKFEGIECGPIQFVDLGGYWLGWSRSKVHENLHAFNDGVIIGKLSFTEKPVDTMISHPENLPAEVHPLSTGLSILRKGADTLIKPFNVTNIFYGGDSVSDMQLLIAEAEGFLPSPEGVGVLATVGYFPGNTTLFSEIKKIPLLVSYELNSKQLTNIPSISYQKPDDVAMVERLKEIVPDHPLHYLGLSAGYDSRFVMGILRQSGVIPELVHIRGDETELVLEIAKQLNLPCAPFEASESTYLSPETYTLATDAQIYFRGGNYSCLRNSTNKDSMFHMGHFSLALNKNDESFGHTAFTRPVFNNRKLYNKLIDFLFIQRKEGMTYGLRAIASLQYLKRYLANELEFGNEYGSSRTRKEWALWFYYLHRGARWTAAHMADLSYFSQPVYLFSDIEALTLSISSPEWLNYKKDRARNLNASLLPELTVPYKDGGHYLVTNGLRNSWEKIEHEYISRYTQYIKGPKKLFNYLDRKGVPEPPKGSVFSFENVNFNAQDFTQYFTNEFHDILSGAKYSNWLKRAAVTVGYTLQFLGH